ncbi:MAG: aminotransferase class I/II-fold pyridoxal phosphate-dependent enzyme, partial [Muribaculaceae bacterium]|nr:aminotransferase class I/II-fold pyridoxal phosphate-dependent enzyme [Muribaculaceae bacterium]
ILIHGSVIDGLRIGSASFKRFPHNNIRKLNDILEKEYQNFDRIIIVTESIYSMDGDEAPLHQLVKLKKSFPNVMLYLDEAHALGVRGAQGLGLAEEYSAINDFDIIIGTLGKAAASVGAFAICDNEMKTYLINTARSFIFSTALPPVNILWSRIMLEQIVTMKKEREYLKELSDWFREMLLVSTGQLSHSTSQIIPLMTGNAAKAIETADKLRENGIIALPIRRPTVPPGGERLRFSLSCDIDKEKLMPVFQILKSLYHN